MGEVDTRALARLVPYRLPKEQVRIAMREHWAAKVEPIATVIGSLFVVLAIGALAPTNLGVLANAAWWLWFVLLLRLIWSEANWHGSWFVATDKRLLLLYGVLTRKVAMMPLHKVTDMSYSRSPLGRVLGYGTFILESAGQDQALSHITYVRDPDETYRMICSQIFGTFDPTEDGPAGWAPADDGSGGSGSGGPGDAPDRDPEEEARRAGLAETTDVPLNQLGGYLSAPPQQHESRWPWRRRREETHWHASHTGGLPARPTDEPAPAWESPADSLAPQDDSTDPAWSVSFDDAPTIQRVDPR